MHAGACQVFSIFHFGHLLFDCFPQESESSLSLNHLPHEHPAPQSLKATLFLVTCGLQQMGGAAQVMLGWA